MNNICKNYDLLKEKDFLKSLKYIREIAEGIACIHSSHIVHLDLKPANIFLDEEDLALIGDFGISNKAEKGKAYMTTDQGTAPYMAPEIWDQRPFLFEPDIFALGVIIYQLMTGKQPFRARFVDEYPFIIGRGIYDQIPLLLIKYKKDNVVAISELIKGCLEVERKKRLQIWEVLGKLYIYIYI